ncbi:hypothetical protein [Yoonia sp. 208BN28-4]|uniref:hypothetical protein n=1 Tax=Yoonia sp. 208BN28-4 TaxID=3126505 RepID=UPI0030B1B7D3
MTMKRRSFLTMLGAALAAPAMPAMGQGAARNLSAAVAAHARKYPLVSVIGLSRRVGVPMPEAEKLLLDLSRRGVVGPVHGCANGPISAASRVFRPVVPYAVRPVTQKKETQTTSRHSQPSRPVNHMLHYLHDLCVQRGLTLSPRALGAVA